LNETVGNANHRRITMPPAAFDLHPATTAHPGNPGAGHDGRKTSRGNGSPHRSWLAELIFAPFQDIDERVRVRR